MQWWPVRRSLRDLGPQPQMRNGVAPAQRNKSDAPKSRVIRGNRSLPNRFGKVWYRQWKCEGPFLQRRNSDKNEVAATRYGNGEIYATGASARRTIVSG